MPDSQNDLTLLGYDTDQSTYTTVKYLRPLNTGDTAGKDTILAYGGSYSFSYAYRSGSRTLAEHNNGEFVVFPMTLNNNFSQFGGESEDEDEEDKYLVHGIILSLAWILLADIAVLIKYFTYFRWRIWVHAILMTVVLLITIVFVFKVLDDNNTLSSLSKKKRAHKFIGVLILAWVMLQVLSGILQGIVFFTKKANPCFLYYMKKFHLYSGIVLMLLGKGNVILGWIMQKNTAGLFVTIVIMVLSLIALAANIIWWRKRGSISREVFKLGGMGFMPGQMDASLLKLMNLPYNNPAVQAARLFIFNDRVFRIRLAAGIQEEKN